jgi:hypothetical protein
MAAAVVPHRRRQLGGNRGEVLHQVVDRLGGQVGLVRQCRVELVDVGLVVLGVVDLHRPRIDVRLQRVVGVR